MAIRHQIFTKLYDTKKRKRLIRITSHELIRADQNLKFHSLINPLNGEYMVSGSGFLRIFGLHNMTNEHLLERLQDPQHCIRFKDLIKKLRQKISCSRLLLKTHPSNELSELRKTVMLSERAVLRFIAASVSRREYLKHKLWIRTFANQVIFRLPAYQTYLI